jgi:hypothetical protein
VDSIFDWLTVLLFIALVVIFFKQGDQRAITVGKFFGAGVALAAADQLGNRGYMIEGWLVIAATVIFSYVFLFEKR